MRRLLCVSVCVVALITACGGARRPSGSVPTTLPGDLVPVADGTAAAVTVTANGHTTPVSADAVARALPMLIRRVFNPPEASSSYGLDRPRAIITFTEHDGSTIVLNVGSVEFDATASYVQRVGDPRVWIVLDQSLAPLLGTP